MLYHRLVQSSSWLIIYLHPSIGSSTDSQLKLWNVNKPHCLRSFKGHINEKNFVGLASNGDYVACGKNWF